MEKQYGPCDTYSSMGEWIDTLDKNPELCASNLYYFTEKWISFAENNESIDDTEKLFYKRTFEALGKFAYGEEFANYDGYLEFIENDIVKKYLEVKKHLTSKNSDENTIESAKNVFEDIQRQYKDIPKQDVDSLMTGWLDTQIKNPDFDIASIHCLTEKWIALADDEELTDNNSSKLFTLYRDLFLVLERFFFGEDNSRRSVDKIFGPYDKIRDGLVRHKGYNEEDMDSVKAIFEKVENPCVNNQ